jgi:hypothetical protein
MKEQFYKALEWAKNREVRACVTGSCLLEYFEGADIDIFCYDEKSFTQLYYEMYHNPMFTILDKLELWKAKQFMENELFNNNKHVSGVTTIKFTYNTCIDVNIILKKNANNIFKVLSSFDIDIISKGYDLETKQYLDLSQHLPDKQATWNKWNTAFYSGEIWKLSRILRQLERCFKYHKRGYNTDEVVLKYIELTNRIEEYESVFSNEGFNDKLKITKENIAIVRKLCHLWLETHEITDEQLELLKQKMKEI